MAQHAKDRTGEALDRIEETLLPSLSMTLEALLDVAGSSHRGASGAAELRVIAEQLAVLTRQVEQVAGRPQPVMEWPLRISA